MDPSPTQPDEPSLLVPIAAIAVVLIGMVGRRKVAIRRKMHTEPEVLHAVPNVGIENLTAGTLAWLRLYAIAAAAKGIPITATSGRRDPRRQAAAMIAKVERGEDLHALYRDDAQITELLSGPKTVERWTAIIEKYAANGKGISNHLSGRAVDIRSRDWTPTQLQEASALAAAMGARRAIIESDHLHIEVGQ